MTLQQINLGTISANGADGDVPRTAFMRINSNFKAIDDMGLTGPVVATREVANLNDASGPGKWIGTAAATNRPAGFTRSSIEVVEEVSGDLLQQVTDKATGQIANRVYTASTDAWSAWVIVGQSDAVLPVAKGGTGGTTQATARDGLGLGGVAVESVVPVAKGGTGGTDQATARVGLGLGTASTANLTTSNIDATPGRVLKVGDYGQGVALNTQPSIASNDINNLTVPGKYYVSAAGGIGQLPVALDGYLDLGIYSVDFQVRTFTEKVAGLKWEQRKASGTWQPWILAGSASGVGWGQSWQNLTSSRSLATVYTNSTQKPIQVTALIGPTSASNVAGLLLVNSIELYGDLSTAAGQYVSVGPAIIPPGQTYQITAYGGTGSLVHWRELRS